MGYRSKKEEKKMWTMLDSRIIKDTRCSKELRKMKIDEITFIDFFNAKRDRI